MKRCMKYVGVLLLAGLLVSCGGGGGGGAPSSPAANDGGTPPSTAGTPPSTGQNNGGGAVSTATQRFEEDDATAVTRSGVWTGADPHGGWSGLPGKGTALESSVKDSSISFSFTGTSVRWIGGRGRNGGIAQVLVDGVEVRRVDLFFRPTDENRTPCFTIYGLSASPHVLTIVVTGDKNPVAAADSPAKVWVDAFEVNPQVVSHIQESDLAVTFSGDWTQASNSLSWSGTGATNGPPEPVVGAKFTETKGASVTLSDDTGDKPRHLNVRGTSISWIGYRGPDGGIAEVSVDNGPVVRVDTYAPDFKVQEVLFTASGLADTSHTLTITATGEKNPRSTAAKIFVDAFDVVKPGKRFEDDSIMAPGTDPTVAPTLILAGPPQHSWQFSNSRVWSGGWAHTNDTAGATATFTFTGTSISWIGCEKSTIGNANVFIDDDPTPIAVKMNRPLGVESFQRTVFRKDGLPPGRHTITVQVTSTDGSFIVVDAFDVVD